MVRCVVAGPSGAVVSDGPLVATARAVLLNTVIARGNDPHPVRTPLPIVLPQVLVEQLQAAHAQQLAAQQQAAQEQGQATAGQSQQPVRTDPNRRAAVESGSAMQQLGSDGRLDRTCRRDPAIQRGQTRPPSTLGSSPTAWSLYFARSAAGQRRDPLLRHREGVHGVVDSGRDADGHAQPREVLDVERVVGRRLLQSGRQVGPLGSPGTAQFVRQPRRARRGHLGGDGVESVGAQPGRRENGTGCRGCAHGRSRPGRQCREHGANRSGLSPPIRVRRPRRSTRPRDDIVPCSSAARSMASR